MSEFDYSPTMEVICAERVAVISGEGVVFGTMIREMHYPDKMYIMVELDGRQTDDR